jgi:hypothetical protein
MRFLNSILIEGSLTAAPSSVTGADGLARCSFCLRSGDDAPNVPIIAYGKLATRCMEMLSTDTVVRVVGRIARDLEASAATESLRLHVVADHVEINTSALRHEAVA